MQPTVHARFWAQIPHNVTERYERGFLRRGFQALCVQQG